jgi:glutamate synthase domain-containing protein 1
MKVVPKRPAPDFADDDDDNFQEDYLPSKRIKNEDAEETKKRSMQRSDDNQMSCSPIKEPNEPLDDEKLEAFEMLYDEIHDVTLPNTLWGHHRCSERKFAVFSRFHEEKMSFNKFLFINERLTCKVFINGRSKKLELEKELCNPEHVSNWLEQIDEEE